AQLALRGRERAPDHGQAGRASTGHAGCQSDHSAAFNTVLPPARADRNGQDDDAGAPDVGKNHDLADSSVPVTTTNHLTQQPHVKNRVPEIVTRGRFPDGGESDSTWRTRRLVMSAPTPLRQDFDAPQVRGLARKTKDGPQARRLLALAAIYDGATRTEAAKIGGVGLQIIRDWVLRFNARGPDSLLDGKSTGQPSKLNDTQRQAIAGMIESGPIPAVHGVVRWRLIDLAQWIFEEFRITIAKQTLSRELRAMGYRKLGIY